MSGSSSRLRAQASSASAARDVGGRLRTGATRRDDTAEPNGGGRTWQGRVVPRRRRSPRYGSAAPPRAVRACSDQARPRAPAACSSTVGWQERWPPSRPNSQHTTHPGDRGDCGKGQEGAVERRLHRSEGRAAGARKRGGRAAFRETGGGEPHRGPPCRARIEEWRSRGGEMVLDRNDSCHTFKRPTPRREGGAGRLRCCQARAGRRAESTSPGGMAVRPLWSTSQDSSPGPGLPAQDHADPAET